MFEKRSDTADGLSQIISGLSSLMSGGQNNHLSMMGSFLDLLNAGSNKRSARDTEHKEESGIDWGNIISMGSMFLQQNANNDVTLGLLPMLLDSLGHGMKDNDAGNKDHSGHSWFLPPILENIHIMWEHFR